MAKEEAEDEVAVVKRVAKMAGEEIAEDEVSARVLVEMAKKGVEVNLGVRKQYLKGRLKSLLPKYRPFSHKIDEI